MQNSESAPASATVLFQESGIRHTRTTTECYRIDSSHSSQLVKTCESLKVYQGALLPGCLPYAPVHLFTLRRGRDSRWILDPTTLVRWFHNNPYLHPPRLRVEYLSWCFVTASYWLLRTQHLIRGPKLGGLLQARAIVQEVCSPSVGVPIREKLGQRLYFVQHSVHVSLHTIHPWRALS